MSNFKTGGRITLQPYDKLGYSFQITICSSSTANDGFIPYGLTVSSCEIIAYNEDLEVVTSDLISGSPSLSDNIVTVTLMYPTTNGIGKYKLTFKLILSDGSTKEADFSRLYCCDK